MTLQDKNQRNALYIASFRRKEDIFQLLLANRTDLFVPGGAYDVALNMACAANWPDDILILLDKGPAFEVPPEIYNRAIKRTKKQQGNTIQKPRDYRPDTARDRSDVEGARRSDETKTSWCLSIFCTALLDYTLSQHNLRWLLLIVRTIQKQYH